MKRPALSGHKEARQMNRTTDVQGSPSWRRGLTLGLLGVAVGAAIGAGTGMWWMMGVLGGVFGGTSAVFGRGRD
jgi:hypothetical protein